MKKQALYLVPVGLLLASLPFAMLKAQTRTNAQPFARPAPAPSFHETATTDAIALWKRLRDSGGVSGTPVSADVVVTSFNASGKIHRQVRITMEEGTGGRYRLTYTGPAAVKGRTVVCDGNTLYQFEPTRNIVLKRQVENVEAALTDASGNITDALIPIIEGSDTLIGRPVRKLALHDRYGRTVRRCFVDEETGRSLRTEEYNPDNGRLLRRVDKSRLVVDTEPDAGRFVPDFPADARTLTAASRRAGNLQVDKAWLGIPSTAGDYRLRTILDPPVKKAGSSSPSGVYHAIYSNGAHTVSIFVTATGSPGGTLSAPEGPGWQTVEVAKGKSGYARTDERGRTGVVWLRDGRRYVLAARLSLSEALGIARNLYKAP